MRLIDADELIKDRVENDNVRIAAMCVPTAYDVDKVIEQLKADEKELQAIIESGARDIYKNTNYGYFTAMNRAIDIVKSGGIE